MNRDNSRLVGLSLEMSSLLYRPKGVGIPPIPFCPSSLGKWVAIDEDPPKFIPTPNSMKGMVPRGASVGLANGPRKWPSTTGSPKLYVPAPVQTWDPDKRLSDPGLAVFKPFRRPTHLR